MSSFIELKNVKKTYVVGDQKFNALDGMDLNNNQGEFVVILGPFGAGKSTLLNLLGGMDKATSGSIIIGEDDIAKFNDKELTRYRAHDVGFIFQFYNIMPTLTVDENVNLILGIDKYKSLGKKYDSLTTLNDEDFDYIKNELKGINVNILKV
jgi:putative ABC transport system ATP-binding protein